jgi:hypothetical protein
MSRLIQTFTLLLTQSFGFSGFSHHSQETEEVCELSYKDQGQRKMEPSDRWYNNLGSEGGN